MITKENIVTKVSGEQDVLKRRAGDRQFEGPGDLTSDQASSHAELSAVVQVPCQIGEHVYSQGRDVREGAKACR